MLILFYYIINRNNTLCYTTNSTLAELLLAKKLKLIHIPLDGFCLLNTVRVGFEHQGVDFSLQNIVDNVRKDINQNLSFYLSFVEYGDSRTFLKCADQYLNSGIFNSTAVDICVRAVCNSMKVFLIIYEEINGCPSKITEIHHPPTTGKYSHTVKLLRSGARPNASSKYSSEHYNVLTVDLNSPHGYRDRSQLSR